MVSVVQNNHAKSVIALDDFNGTPVLAHSGGNYPEIVDDDGKKIDHYIEVARWHDGFTVTAIAGSEASGRKIFYTVGREYSSSLAEVAALYPAALQTIAELPRMHAEAQEQMRLYGLHNGALTRAAYVSIMADIGVAPRSDKEIQDCGLEYGDYGWPSYTLAEIAPLWLAQRRAFGIKKEIAAEQIVAADKPAASAEPTGQAQRRQMLVAAGTPAQFTIGRSFYRIVSRKLGGWITEDDPSIHGSHLLGHEGEPAEIVTVEITE